MATICTQFLEDEHFPGLPWPAYSPDMSPIEHVWDALVPVPTNIQQLRKAIEEEWDHIVDCSLWNVVPLLFYWTGTSGPTLQSQSIPHMLKC